MKPCHVETGGRGPAGEREDPFSTARLKEPDCISRSKTILGVDGFMLSIEVDMTRITPSFRIEAGSVSQVLAKSN